ncbi:hypothetical protein P9VFCI_129 [Rhizobium phage P9VFCI]|uniref:Uncharacterized protein n=1 Tax=Rhizobium phage P9VFCI TaxID=2763531 RepID=A0A7G7WXJ2_9CAUD|nr:hypothetical protein PP937_gp129 [Rhizobium phage P9VFCI]QNH71936.1 hypothetical protein P9VFCI_129 [Rhizobium phage P9VFCI]
MGLTLFVYGEVSALNFEVLPKIEDDQDAYYHLQTCIEDVSRCIAAGKKVLATHIPISTPEFNDWVESGYFSSSTEKLLKDRIRQTQAIQLPEEDEDDDSC